METKIKIIGLSGKSASGKTYLAKNYFWKKFGFMPFSLAFPIKMQVISKGLATYQEVFKDKPSHIRSLLQEEGSGPRLANENIWIDTLFAYIQYFHETYGFSRYVIDDVRFKNEALAIKNKDGFVFRIDATSRTDNNALTPEQRTHISETDLDDVPFSDFFCGHLYNNENENDTLDWQISNIITSIINP